MRDIHLKDNRMCEEKPLFYDGNVYLYEINMTAARMAVAASVMVNQKRGLRSNTVAA